MKESTLPFAMLGPALEAEITCGEIQMGSYSVRLWEPDRVTVVRKARGVFLDDEEDRFPLPTPAAQNDKRILQCRARIWLIPPHKNFALTMTLRQGDQDIGDITDSGTSDDPTHICEVRIVLAGA